MEKREEGGEERLRRPEWEIPWQERRAGAQASSDEREGEVPRRARSASPWRAAKEVVSAAEQVSLGSSHDCRSLWTHLKPVTGNVGRARNSGVERGRFVYKRGFNSLKSLKN